MRAAAATDLSRDRFLGGRVEAVQPLAGHHRAGLEAVLLAAALPEDAAGAVMDLGAGVGVAGLCVAARCGSASVVLVERQAELLAAADAALGLAANRAFAGRVRSVEADVLSARARKLAGLLPASADHILVNPPFHAAGGGSRSPKAGRATAHVLEEGGVDAWLRAAADLARPRGTATFVFHADGLLPLLNAFAGRFGAPIVLPLQARTGEPAFRVIVQGVKGSRSASVSLLPPLVLHGAKGNGFRASVERILRHGASLAEVHAPWQKATRRAS